MKPKIDLENLKSIYEDYYQGFGGNVDVLADSVPDLIELIEEAKDVINGCVVMPTITGGFRENEAAKQWLSRFKKENKNA